MHERVLTRVLHLSHASAATHRHGLAEGIEESERRSCRANRSSVDFRKVCDQVMRRRGDELVDRVARQERNAEKRKELARPNEEFEQIHGGCYTFAQIFFVWHRSGVVVTVPCPRKKVR